MKNKCLILAIGVLFCMPKITFAQIANWNFTGQNGAISLTATNSHSDLDSVPVLTRGPNALPSSAANSFRTAGFKNDGVSTTNTDYFEFKLIAKNITF